MKQGLIPRGYSRFDIAEGWYWFLSNYHTGQASEMYSRLSKLKKYFRPSLRSNFPTTRESLEIYHSLVAKD